MRITSARKPAALALACALALAALSASAQVVDPAEKALLVNTQGGPVMTGAGECWHMASGPAPQWTAACHPASAARYIAPVVALQPQRAPAPVTLAAAAPAPAALAVYEKVAFDANVLFDSDSSSLRPAGRDSLDAFVASIHGLESRDVMAVGYADRMGSAGSNQTLSEERVSAVKAYLVGKGVAQDRVRTSAWGETRPDTHLADCKEANNAKNVACMQPDRHVTIEISGSRMAAQ